MTDNALWQFSLLVYSQPRVHRLCQLLQDEYGADVNLLLSACWLAKRGIVWTPQQVADMVAKSREFRENYLFEARALRRKLKHSAPPSVYQEAQRFEMAVERWQQDEIYDYWLKASAAPKKQSFSLCAQTNLHRYFDQLELAWNGQMSELVEAVAATPPAEGD
ncbi:TIGR02444 family protein [Litorivivens sp.]|uniref:TIGR02444 family protein n=1 Tax=Litorivivens sp. TaxID=2020868 RepID=UPI00356856E3